MEARNPVVWFEIYVNDLQRAKKFYETVLNVKLAKLENPTKGALQMLSFPSDMNGSGASGALVKMEGLEVRGGISTLVYFSCEDCKTEENRIEKAGGKIQTPKMSIGEYGFVSLASDTEGNMFGLHSRK
jgi:predicted enzyme related to lactoylglutathione lyase